MDATAEQKGLCLGERPYSPTDILTCKFSSDEFEARPKRKSKRAKRRSTSTTSSDSSADSSSSYEYRWEEAKPPKPPFQPFVTSVNIGHTELPAVKREFYAVVPLKAVLVILFPNNTPEDLEEGIRKLEIHQLTKFEADLLTKYVGGLHESGIKSFAVGDRIYVAEFCRGEVACSYESLRDKFVAVMESITVESEDRSPKNNDGDSHQGAAVEISTKHGSPIVKHNLSLLPRVTAPETANDDCESAKENRPDVAESVLSNAIFSKSDLRNLVGRKHLQNSSYKGTAEAFSPRTSNSGILRTIDEHLQVRGEKIFDPADKYNDQIATVVDACKMKNGLVLEHLFLENEGDASESEIERISGNAANKQESKNCGTNSLVNITAEGTPGKRSGHITDFAVEESGGRGSIWSSDQPDSEEERPVELISSIGPEADNTKSCHVAEEDYKDAAFTPKASVENSTSKWKAVSSADNPGLCDTKCSPMLTNNCIQNADMINDDMGLATKLKSSLNSNIKIVLNKPVQTVRSVVCPIFNEDSYEPEKSPEKRVSKTEHPMHSMKCEEKEGSPASKYLNSVVKIVSVNPVQTMKSVVCPIFHKDSYEPEESLEKHVSKTEHPMHSIKSDEKGELATSKASGNSSTAAKVTVSPIGNNRIFSQSSDSSSGSEWKITDSYTCKSPERYLNEESHEATDLNASKSRHASSRRTSSGKDRDREGHRYRAKASQRTKNEFPVQRQRSLKESGRSSRTERFRHHKRDSSRSPSADLKSKSSTRSSSISSLDDLSLKRHRVQPSGDRTSLTVSHTRCKTVYPWALDYSRLRFRYDSTLYSPLSSSEADFGSSDEYDDFHYNRPVRKVLHPKSYRDDVRQQSMVRGEVNPVARIDISNEKSMSSHIRDVPKFPIIRDYDDRIQDDDNSVCPDLHTDDLLESMLCKDIEDLVTSIRVQCDKNPKSRNHSKSPTRPLSLGRPNTTVYQSPRREPRNRSQKQRIRRRSHSPSCARSFSPPDKYFQRRVSRRRRSLSPLRNRNSRERVDDKNRLREKGSTLFHEHRYDFIRPTLFKTNVIDKLTDEEGNERGITRSSEMHYSSMHSIHNTDIHRVSQRMLIDERTEAAMQAAEYGSCQQFSHSAFRDIHTNQESGLMALQLQQQFCSQTDSTWNQYSADSSTVRSNLIHLSEPPVEDEQVIILKHRNDSSSSTDELWPFLAGSSDLESSSLEDSCDGEVGSFMAGKLAKLLRKRERTKTSPLGNLAAPVHVNSLEPDVHSLNKVSTSESMGQGVIKMNTHADVAISDEQAAANTRKFQNYVTTTTEKPNNECAREDASETNNSVLNHANGRMHVPSIERPLRESEESNAAESVGKGTTVNLGIKSSIQELDKKPHVPLSPAAECTATVDSPCAYEEVVMQDTDIVNNAVTTTTSGPTRTEITQLNPTGATSLIPPEDNTKAVEGNADVICEVKIAENGYEGEAICEDEIAQDGMCLGATITVEDDKVKDAPNQNAPRKSSTDAKSWKKKLLQKAQSTAAAETPPVESSLDTTNEILQKEPPSDVSNIGSSCSHGSSIHTPVFATAGESPKEIDKSIPHSSCDSNDHDTAPNCRILSESNTGSPDRDSIEKPTPIDEAVAKEQDTIQSIVTSSCGLDATATVTVETGVSYTSSSPQSTPICSQDNPTTSTSSVAAQSLATYDIRGLDSNQPISLPKTFISTSSGENNRPRVSSRILRSTSAVIEPDSEVDSQSQISKTVITCCSSTPVIVSNTSILRSVNVKPLESVVETVHTCAPSQNIYSTASVIAVVSQNTSQAQLASIDVSSSGKQMGACRLTTQESPLNKLASSSAESDKLTTRHLATFVKTTINSLPSDSRMSGKAPPRTHEATSTLSKLRDTVSTFPVELTVKMRKDKFVSRNQPLVSTAASARSATTLSSSRIFANTASSITITKKPATPEPPVGLANKTAFRGPQIKIKSKEPKTVLAKPWESKKKGPSNDDKLSSLQSLNNPMHKQTNDQSLSLTNQEVPFENTLDETSHARPAPVVSDVLPGSKRPLKSILLNRNENIHRAVQSKKNRSFADCGQGGFESSVSKAALLPDKSVNIDSLRRNKDATDYVGGRRNIRGSVQGTNDLSELYVSAAETAADVFAEETASPTTTWGYATSSPQEERYNSDVTTVIQSGSICSTQSQKQSVTASNMEVVNSSQPLLTTAIDANMDESCGAKPVSRQNKKVSASRAKKVSSIANSGVSSNSRNAENISQGNRKRKANQKVPGSHNKRKTKANRKNSSSDHEVSTSVSASVEEDPSGQKGSDERFKQGEEMIHSLLPFIKSRAKPRPKPKSRAKLEFAFDGDKNTGEKSSGMQGTKRTSGRTRGRTKRRRRLPSISSDEDIIEELNAGTQQPKPERKSPPPDSESSAPENDDSDDDLVSFMGIISDLDTVVPTVPDLTPIKQDAALCGFIKEETIISDSDELETDTDEDIKPLKSKPLRPVVKDSHVVIRDMLPNSKKFSEPPYPRTDTVKCSFSDDDQNIFTKMSKEMEESAFSCDREDTTTSLDVFNEKTDTLEKHEVKYSAVIEKNGSVVSEASIEISKVSPKIVLRDVSSKTDHSSVVSGNVNEKIVIKCDSNDLVGVSSTDFQENRSTEQNSNVVEGSTSPPKFGGINSNLLTPPISPTSDESRKNCPNKLPSPRPLTSPTQASSILNDGDTAKASAALPTSSNAKLESDISSISPSEDTVLIRNSRDNCDNSMSNSFPQLDIAVAAPDEKQITVPGISNLIAAAAELAGVPTTVTTAEASVGKNLPANAEDNSHDAVPDHREAKPFSSVTSNSSAVTKTPSKARRERITLCCRPMPEGQSCHGFLEICLSAAGQNGKVTYALRRIPYVKTAAPVDENEVPLDFHKSAVTKEDEKHTFPTSNAFATYLRLRDVICLLKLHAECLFSLVVRSEAALYYPSEYARRLFAVVYDPIAETDSVLAKMTRRHSGSEKLQEFLDHMIVLDKFLHAILPKFYTEALNIKTSDVPGFVNVKIFKPIIDINEEVVKIFRKPYEYNSMLWKKDEVVKCNPLQKRRFSSAVLSNSRERNSSSDSQSSSSHPTDAKQQQEESVHRGAPCAIINNRFSHYRHPAGIGVPALRHALLNRGHAYAAAPHTSAAYRYPNRFPTTAVQTQGLPLVSAVRFANSRLQSPRDLQTMSQIQRNGNFVIKSTGCVNAMQYPNIIHYAGGANTSVNAVNGRRLDAKQIVQRAGAGFRVPIPSDQPMRKIRSFGPSDFHPQVVISRSSAAEMKLHSSTDMQSAISNVKFRNPADGMYVSASGALVGLQQPVLKADSATPVTTERFLPNASKLTSPKRTEEAAAAVCATDKEVDLMKRKDSDKQIELRPGVDSEHLTGVVNKLRSRVAPDETFARKTKKRKKDPTTTKRTTSTRSRTK